MDENCAKAWRYLGMCYVEQSATVPPMQEFEAKALDCYRRAYSCAPHDRWVVHNLACFLGYLGRLDEARSIVDSYAKIQFAKADRLRKIIKCYEDGSTRGMSQDPADCCEN
jgi:hypothetical protein